MHDENRRKLLAAGGSLLAAGLLASRGARASEHEGHSHPAKGVPSVAIEASREGVCATCRYWGGIRRASEDKKTVHAESLGWCSNPESHHYQAMTTPETGPMKSWKKWEAL
jgi:hypothetical protein